VKPQAPKAAKGGTEKLINELLAILAIPDEASRKAALLAHMKANATFYADGAAVAASRDPARVVALTTAFRASGLSDAALARELAKPTRRAPAKQAPDRAKREQRVEATRAALTAMGLKPGKANGPFARALAKAYRGE
jgi:hypothetical protein